MNDYGRLTTRKLLAEKFDFHDEFWYEIGEKNYTRVFAQQTYEFAAFLSSTTICSRFNVSFIQLEGLVKLRLNW